MGKQAFLSYCPKCGNQGIYENGNEICQYCGTKELPTKYDWDKWLFGNSYPEHLDKIIFEEYIKNKKINKIEKIAKYFGVTTDYMMGKKSEIPSASMADDHLELIKLYSSLSEADQKAIMQIMRSMNK